MVSRFARLTLLAGVLAMASSVVVPQVSAAPPKAPAWKPVGDATASFSAAIIRWDQAQATRHLTDNLRSQADRKTVHSMLGIQATPHRYWYWVNTFDGKRARVTLTHYFPAGRGPITNGLEWIKVGANWRIARITHAAAPAPDPAPVWKAVGAAASGLGYAVTRGDDTAINHYATPALLKSAPAGYLINLLGMQNIPGNFRYTVDSVQGANATVTMEWIFGNSPVIDRLDWVQTNAGWRIANVSVLSP